MTVEFKCIGSIIDFFLDDVSDTKERKIKENKAVGALSFISNTKSISIDIKISLYSAILVNVALWNTKI